MKSGILLVILGLVIIMAAVAFALYGNQQAAPEVAACTLEAKTCPDGTVVGREGPNCEFATCSDVESAKKAVFSWSFTQISVTDDMANPQTQVMLTYNTEAYNLGTHDGSCTAIAVSGWTLLPDEQDAAICYFAGVGTEFGIFLEDTNLIVKQGVIEEGSEEVSGFRGDFTPLFILN